jgi:hypothetical protein
LDAQGLATIIGAAALFITSVEGVRQNRIGNKRIEKVHEIVNSERTEMKERITQLADVIRESGIKVPPQP